MNKKNGTAWITLDEQETVIQFSRCDDYATISTSDTTQKTRLNKLCEKNPQNWALEEDGEVFARYRCTPKSLISLRTRPLDRVLPEEERLARAERLREYRNKQE